MQKVNAKVALKLQIEPNIKQVLKPAYSKQLLDILFSNLYIKVKVLEEHKIAKRQTASEYLKKMETVGLLSSLKIGTETHYINNQLTIILSK